MVAPLSPVVIRKAAEELVKKRQSPPVDHRRLKTGYILMLDVLGFKEMVSKDKGEDFIDLWTGIRDTLFTKKFEVEGRIKAIEIDLLCLSDTIIICLSLKEGKSKVNPRLLLSIMPQILDSFFMDLFRKKVFMRGAISFGQYRCDMNSSIVMGKALDEAYEWHEVTEWIGVILTPSAKYALDQYILNSPLGDPLTTILENRFIRYDVPFKKDVNIETFTFVWFFVGRTDKERVQVLGEILGILSEVKYSISTALKYENTIKLVKSLLVVDLQNYKQLQASQTPLLTPKEGNS